MHNLPELIENVLEILGHYFIVEARNKDFGSVGGAASSSSSLLLILVLASVEFGLLIQVVLPKPISIGV
jgi:hypothetical protein